MSALLLQKIEDAGVAVLTLTEGIEESEFLRSSLTKREACRQLGLLCEAAGAVSPSVQASLPEIDWNAWLAFRDKASDNRQVWQIISGLLPTTLMWLRVHRKQQPDLFAMVLS